MEPDEVEVGTIIIIKSGERVPLDGIVVDGESWIDTAALTGESLPRKAAAGDGIISGCVNGSGTLRVGAHEEMEKWYQAVVWGRILLPALPDTTHQL